MARQVDEIKAEIGRRERELSKRRGKPGLGENVRYLENLLVDLRNELDANG